MRGEDRSRWNTSRMAALWKKRSADFFLAISQDRSRIPIAMTANFKSLILCLAALAVGMVQVFGVQAGYLCGCTGKVSQISACETVVCHPSSDCISGADSKCASDLNSDSDQKYPDKGEHSEVRTQLVVTQFSGAFVLPLLVLSDIPPAFHMPDFHAVVLDSLLVVERPEPPEYGSPPMPQLVAQTIVMLV